MAIPPKTLIFAPAHLGCWSEKTLVFSPAEIIPTEPARVMPGREMKEAANGSFAFHRYEAGILPAVKRNAVPTQGAGDCFTQLFPIL